MTELIKLPPGLFCFWKLFKIDFYRRRFHLNRTIVFFATLLGYVAFHASRKPFSVVKNVLAGSGNSTNNATFTPGYAPFNGSNHVLYFSTLDTTWAVSYAVSMFINGYVAEHLPYTYVMGGGLMVSGVICMGFGFAKIWGIHQFWYFVLLMLASGFVQSSGWPCCLAIMSSWFEGSKQGAVFGIWSSNGPIGNILGQALAAKFVLTDWSLSFIIPGAVAIVYGFLVFMFLIHTPKQLGFTISDTNHILGGPSETVSFEVPEKENAELIPKEPDNKPVEDSDKPLGFFKAVLLPGVIEYSFSLFFSKMVVYTFLFWLPFYIKQIGIKNYVVTPENAGYLSLLFDIGGIAGGFSAGLIADVTKTSGICCICLQLVGALVVYLYSLFGSTGYYTAVGLLVLSGFFVYAPTTLISTAIASGIASNPSLRGRGAKSTVTGINSGMGSLGSALGPLIVNFVSKFGWEKIMVSMMVSLLLSAVFIMRQVINEIRGLVNARRGRVNL